MGVIFSQETEYIAMGHTGVSYFLEDLIFFRKVWVIFLSVCTSFSLNYILILVIS